MRTKIYFYFSKHRNEISLWIWSLLVDDSSSEKFKIPFDNLQVFDNNIRVSNSPKKDAISTAILT
jgi:hypothetical protein